MDAITAVDLRVGGYGKRVVRVGIVVLGVLLSACCGRSSPEYVDVLTEMGSDDYAGSRDFVAEKARLEGEIKRLRAEVEARVTAAADLGLYYKYLGLHYFDHEMYEYALQSFTEAIRVSPTSGLLFYYAAVSAAYVAKARVDPEERVTWLQRSEGYYRRCLEIEPGLVRALFGYAVLLDFELERPWDAKPLLERILTVEKKNFDAMFELARVYYQLGEVSEAVELYRRIEGESRSEESVAAARELLRQLEGESGGRR